LRRITGVHRLDVPDGVRHEVKIEQQQRLEVGVADLEEPVEPQARPAHVVDEDIDDSVSVVRFAHEPLRPARLGQVHRNRAAPSMPASASTVRAPLPRGEDGQA
jgi:hypothetical protein